VVYIAGSGYTGYNVDNQQLKWLHNWLQIFKSGYMIDSQRLKWLHYVNDNKAGRYCPALPRHLNFPDPITAQ
jgi:hypothetical protein